MRGEVSKVFWAMAGNFSAIRTQNAIILVLLLI